MLSMSGNVKQSINSRFVKGQRSPAAIFVQAHVITKTCFMGSQPHGQSRQSDPCTLMHFAFSSSHQWRFQDSKTSDPDTHATQWPHAAA